MKLVATVGERTHAVEVTGTGGRYRVAIGERVWEVDARLTPQGIYSLLVGSESYVADVTDQEGGAVVEVAGETYAIRVEEATRYTIRTHGGAVGAGGTRTLTAPMPGKISHVAVAPGEAVKAGDTLLVIEAMKMENELKATAAGTVTEVRVAAGQPVNSGQVLMVIVA